MRSPGTGSRCRRSIRLRPCRSGRPRTADAVLDLEITTNRPDCLSMVGIAREVATIYALPLTGPTLNAAVPGREPLPVTIEDDARDLCPRYAAAVADVTVAAAPGWMAARLEAAGVRPINNIVDVTNYVMLELGHPLHAFDLDRLAGEELRVRLARPGETVRTLDGVERTLPAGTLVIADARARAGRGRRHGRRRLGGGRLDAACGPRERLVRSARGAPQKNRLTVWGADCVQLEGRYRLPHILHCFRLSRRYRSGRSRRVFSASAYAMAFSRARVRSPLTLRMIASCPVSRPLARVMCAACGDLAHRRLRFASLTAIS